MVFLGFNRPSSVIPSSSTKKHSVDAIIGTFSTLRIRVGLPVPFGRVIIICTIVAASAKSVVGFRPLVALMGVSFICL